MPVLKNTLAEHIKLLVLLIIFGELQAWC